MGTESYRQDFWRYEADKLLLTERFARRARNIALLCSAVPFSISLMSLVFGNIPGSLPFTIIAVTLVMITSCISLAADSYFKTVRARLGRDREQQPSPDNR